MAVTETMFDKMLDTLLKIKDILEEKLWVKLDIQKTLGLHLNAKYVVKKHLGLTKEQDPITARNVWRMWRLNEI